MERSGNPVKICVRRSRTQPRQSREMPLTLTLRGNTMTSKPDEPKFILNAEINSTDAIKYCASKYEECARKQNTNEESHWNEEIKLIELCECIKKRGWLKKDDLYCLAKWKSRLGLHYIENNDRGYVEEVTKFALSTTNERVRIESLTLLDGVAWPIASAILHLCHKDKYPILDFRALWAAGVEAPSTYKYKFWKKYVAFCRDTAKRYKVDMRTLDRAMWCYGKINPE